MTILKVKTSRQKKICCACIEIEQKFESEISIHNEDLISRLLRWFNSFRVEVWVVSLCQKIQPGISGRLYLQQKSIDLISRP